MPQTPLKRGDRGGGVLQEAAQGIPAGGGDSGTPGLGVTEGGGSVPSRKSRKLEPASVRALRAWHQLPGRTESSPNSPGGGETIGQDLGQHQVHLGWHRSLAEKRVVSTQR